MKVSEDEENLPAAFGDEDWWEENWELDCPIRIKVGQIRMEDIFRSRFDHTEAMMEIGITKDMMRIAKKEWDLGQESTVYIKATLLEPVGQIELSKNKTQKMLICHYEYWV